MYIVYPGKKMLGKGGNEAKPALNHCTDQLNLALITIVSCFPILRFIILLNKMNRAFVLPVFPQNRQTNLLRQQAKYHHCCYWLVLMKGREGKVSLSHAAAVWQKSLSSFCKIFAMGKLDQWVTMQ